VEALTACIDYVAERLGGWPGWLTGLAGGGRLTDDRSDQYR